MNVQTSNNAPLVLTAFQNQQLLLIKGPDAVKFLQGQVTCDVKTLSEGTTCLGAQCNPKGRVLLTFRAMQMGEQTIALRIPTSMQSLAVKNLAKYIVFSKAEIINAQEDYFLYGLLGKHLETVARELGFSVPVERDSVVQATGNYFIKLDDERLECWIPKINKQHFELQLAALTQQGTENDWASMDIAQGIPTVFPETVELFTPQDINYQLVDGVSFRKGCYTGQEIVARLHYRGKLKRHMFRFVLASSNLPEPGATILRSDTQQSAGQVVMAARVSDDEIELLASVTDEHLNELCAAGGTQKLKLRELPYAIPTADEKTE